MKKYLPIVLLVVGLLVVIVVFFVVRGRKNPEDVSTDEESSLVEVPIDKRPLTSLTPSEDGHTLSLSIQKLMIEGSSSMDYELLYTFPDPETGDSRTAGVPGTIKISGEDISRALLLGSESSGKKRYDEGVEGGTLTLRFRNDKGKLIAKFSSGFQLVNNVDTISYEEDKLKVEVSEGMENYFVVMETFGLPGSLPWEIESGPIGIFSSADFSLKSYSLGNGASYRWDDQEGGWLNSELENVTRSIFVGASGNPQG